MNGTVSRKFFDFNSGTPQNRQKALLVTTYPLAPIQQP
jgi:hypothetical protein